jgi:hypothetical protein
VADMKQDKFESERIQVNDNPEELEIIISGAIPKKQFVALSAWLLAWTFAGGYVITQMFTNLPSETKIFMGVWLIFWIYFEYKIGSAWLWRKYGREVLRLRKDKSELRFEVSYGGRAEEFNTIEIHKVELTEATKGIFVKNYFSSFWVVGGEAISFLYNGKQHLFGRQLPLNDATFLFRKIDARLKRWK